MIGLCFFKHVPRKRHDERNKRLRHSVRVHYPDIQENFRAYNAGRIALNQSISKSLGDILTQLVRNVSGRILDSLECLTTLPISE